MPECEECVDFNPACRQRAKARQALRERFMPEKLRLELRLIEIATEFKAATQWGAYLGALEEERRNVQARYNQLQQTGE